MMSKVTVIIPAYNNFSGLKYLLCYFKKRNYPLIIIDNKPSIFKNKLIKDFEKSNLIYLPQKKNLGFAAAVNLGATQVKTKWMLILNDDVEFKNPKSEIRNKFKIQNKNIIEKLIKNAEEEKFDALSPILINPQGIIENCGYKVLPYGKVKLVKKLESYKVHKVDKVYKVYKVGKVHKVNEIDGLTAACLLIKTEVFKKLNDFDERFFAYLEDVDFFLRFKKAGYKMGVSENISVFHHQLTTSKTWKGFKEWYDFVNWWRLYFKHQDKFKFNGRFLLERVKNFWGLLKNRVNIPKVSRVFHL